jgi:hypothetical protein
MGEQEKMCERCGKAPATEPHTCPYYDEIYDEEIICTCCEECEQGCCDDI